jgi:hypothetical protein
MHKIEHIENSLADQGNVSILEQSQVYFHNFLPYLHEHFSSM